MKKIAIALFIVLFMMPMEILGQTYSSLWKRVADAGDQDLPQTQQQVLQQIVDKARMERAYGQLLKAELLKARVAAEVSPDSLEPAVRRLAETGQQTDDVVLRAVYDAVLACLYRDISQLGEQHEQTAADYFAKALAHPDELARAKAGDYKPFVVEGDDSRIYGDDMLSVIGREAKAYRLLHDYYVASGNRRAACLSMLDVILQDRQADRQELHKSEYLHRIDSVIEQYRDLPEAGELAIEHYNFMAGATNAKPEEKIQYIHYALQQWGSWPRMNELRNAERRLTLPQFDVQVEHAVQIPDQPQEVKFYNLRNVQAVKMNVYSVKADGDIGYDPNTNNDYKKVKPLLTALPALSAQRSFVGKPDYQLFDDSLTLGALPVGVYMLEFETVPATRVQRMLYFVTDVFTMMEGLPDETTRYVVVNATTGQPVKGAQLRISMWESGHGKSKDVIRTTDAKGEVLFQHGRDRVYRVYTTTKTDRACPPTGGYDSFSYYQQRDVSQHVNIYTDRSIYRPGQTVHAAVIVYQTLKGLDHEVLTGRQVKMQLVDANYKVVAEKQVVTDGYGACAADFTLPSGGLTGNYTIRADGMSVSFRVEEYKRPTFLVEFPTVTDDYQDGDTLSVTATARSYAGVPVQGARVSYKVVRRRSWWWLTYSRYWQGGYFGEGSADEEMLKASAVTDDEGRFTVKMPMMLPKTSDDRPQFYSFVVTADVTDGAGETHQGQLSLPLGNRRSALTCDLPEKVLSDSLSPMTFRRFNAAGNAMDGEVRYQIEKLGNSKTYELTSLKTYELLNSKTATTVKTNTPVTLPRLSSGRYRLVAAPLLPATGQEEAADAPLVQEFIVFSLSDKRPCVETDDWFYQSASRFPQDGNVTVQVGSSAKDVHIVYNVLSGNQVLESGTVDNTNELVNRKMTYREEYGNGVLMTFAWVKNGHFYRHEARIERPRPDKQLRMQWTTFRDRLTPGQQEEWTLSVVKPDGQPADAQLMATLYDMSLDQIRQHGWSLSPYVWLPLPHTQWRSTDWGSVALSAQQAWTPLTVCALCFNRFDSSVFPRYHAFVRLTRIGRSSMLKGAVVEESMPVMMAASAADMADVVEAKANGTATTDEEQVPETVESTQVRENLQETAFFYPQLTTDTNGQVALKFTLPESLTTWRFMGIAHTADMYCGQLGGEAVAKKDVMVQPNMPRFVRQGDRATISARIFNTGEKPVSGTARLQLIDPETSRQVSEVTTRFSADVNATAVVTFAVDPAQQQLDRYSLLIARVTASGNGFSDGEQHYLPILPNRERVTVAVPFTQNGPGTKTIDLAALLPKAEANPQFSALNSKLTIEYTNNPAWLMVQALPYVGKPSDENAVSQAAAYYANMLGKYIIGQNPSARQVFAQWQQEQGSETSLMSSLEKDQDLKDLVLNETPWVMDADREDEQKQRLADFFDENTMDYRIGSALDKLRKLQQGSGAWSWWPDMPGSFYMTVSVSEMLARLNVMTGEQPQTRQMLSSAFGFMGREIVDLVAHMKREEKKGHKQVFPSFKALQWLYICTIDGRELPADVQKSNDYLLALLKKDVKNQTLYEKALSAVILNSPQYVKSLKEYTVYKEEMGRYYDTPRAAYSWFDYRIPTQVAAIEAMRRVTPDDTETVNEMLRWLLQSKRTQAWDTPINSTNAVYAFLNGRSETLRPQEHTTLKVDGREVDAPKATAGLGYVKTALPAQGTRTFTAEKTSTGTSWGALYAQFMQPMSDIAAQSGGLTVSRELRLLDQNVPGSITRLHVGDRVKVRITIVADRDYDFVQVLDRRAACMEPVRQLSGYNDGAYCTPKDYSTNYYFDMLSKGSHVIETEYYIDREGTYETGTCTVQCAYSPEFRATAKSETIIVK